MYTKEKFVNVVSSDTTAGLVNICSDFDFDLIKHKRQRKLVTCKYFFFRFTLSSKLF